MIKFEKCTFCGKKSVRKYLKYNQSRDEFYYVWECLDCGKCIYDDVDENEIKNLNSAKIICLWCQRWNMMIEKSKREEKEVCLNK